MNNVRVIFHIDMNAFFASCEEIKRPFLADKPFAVGVRYSQKGVLSTCNYVARKFGVHSAMTVKDAKKLCPELIIVDSDYAFYEECSHNFMKFLFKYTKKIEQASIDEAYVDVTDIDMHPLELAKEIQQGLLETYKLPCSIGIGPNLFLAKMGSDLKKPLGITVVRKRDIPKLLFPLDVGETFGIGKKTTASLKEKGIMTIGDLYNRLEEIKESYGKRFYEDVYQKLNGLSSNVVDPTRYSSYSSIGNSRTAYRPLETEEDNYEFLDYVISLVCSRLKSENVLAKTISVQIKYTNFQTSMRGKTINEPTNDIQTITDISRSLFDICWNGEPVRLLGVSASNLVKPDQKIFDLFHLEYVDKEEKLHNALNNIQEKHGKSAIKKGFK